MIADWLRKQIELAELRLRKRPPERRGPVYDFEVEKLNHGRPER